MKNWIFIGLVFTFILALSVYSNAQQSCQLVQPYFGRTACEAISSGAENKYTKIGTFFGIGGSGSKSWTPIEWSFIKQWAITEACGDDENTKECAYYFQALKPDGDTSASSYSGVSSLNYRVCNDPDLASCTNWIQKVIIIQANERLDLIQIPRGKYINVYVNVQAGQDRAKTNPVLISKYDAYGLTTYDSGAKTLTGVKSCNINDIPNINAKICKNKLTAPPLYGGATAQFIQDKTCSAFETDTGLHKSLVESQRLEYEDWVNYVSYFQPAIEDLNNKIINWKGQQVYIQPSGQGVAIYKIEQLSVKSGACYRIPTSLIANDGSIQCIPGQETANAICVQEGDRTYFKPRQVGECSSNSDCTSKLGSGYICQQNVCQLAPQCYSDLQCPASGSFLTDTTSASPQVVRYSCIQNQCKIVEKKQVQCTPLSTGCESGSVCDPRTYICIKQTGGITPPQKNEIINIQGFLLNFIGGAIIMIVLIASIKILGIFVPLLARISARINIQRAAILTFAGSLILAFLFTDLTITAASLVMT